MERLLLRITEAAEMLGLSRSEAHVLIQAGVCGRDGQMEARRP